MCFQSSEELEYEKPVCLRNKEIRKVHNDTQKCTCKGGLRYMGLMRKGNRNRMNIMEYDDMEHGDDFSYVYISS